MVSAPTRAASFSCSSIEELEYFMAFFKRFGISRIGVTIEYNSVPIKTQEEQPVLPQEEEEKHQSTEAKVAASVPAIPSDASKKGGNKVDYYDSGSNTENPCVTCAQLARERNDPASVILPALHGRLFCLNHDPSSSKPAPIFCKETRTDIPGGALNGELIESIICTKCIEEIGRVRRNKFASNLFKDYARFHVEKKHANDASPIDYIERIDQPLVNVHLEELRKLKEGRPL
nr:hypothetical protein [uncultured Nitrososphaera sp.]